MAGQRLDHIVDVNDIADVPATNPLTEIGGNDRSRLEVKKEIPDPMSSLLRLALCLTAYLVLAAANYCYGAGGTWTTNETHWFDRTQNIVRYVRVVTTTPYQHEISSLVDKTMSAPAYDGDGNVVGRDFWPISVRGAPSRADVIRTESNYRWNAGELTRSVKEIATKQVISQTLDSLGYLVEESFEADRGRITIRYEWKNGRCLSAVALQEDRVIARATAVSVDRAPSGVYFQEVREQYFAPSGGGPPQYEARSKFAISYRAEKIDQRAIAGKKQITIFRHWGTEEVSMIWMNTGAEGVIECSGEDRKGNVLAVKFTNNRDETASTAVATVNNSVVVTSEAVYHLSK
jgi:hypothetical protein